MRNNINDMILFIDSIRTSDQYIEHIYLEGGCYQFHLLLSKLFKGCEPFINNKENHIVTKYRGKFFDIRGMVDDEIYRPLRPDDIKRVKKWSFHKHNLLKISECPNCDEPLIYNS